MPALPDRTAIEDAARLVHAVMPPTPQYAWPLLIQALGTEVWVKHENHTPTGAFKLRGGLAYFDRLRRAEPDCAGVIGATRGNHGQSMAFAARRAGLACTIVVPHANSPEKNAAMRALGATLIEHGADFQAAREQAGRMAAEQRLHSVPPFHFELTGLPSALRARDSPLGRPGGLMRGVATYWAEFFAAVPDLNAVYVPIGQGSGISACAAARNAYSPRTRIIGVVSAHAPCYALSTAAGRAVEAPATTQLADGMACRVPDADALAIIRREVERIVQVTDEEIAAAMRLLFTATHNVAEGAGAAPLAAAWQERHALFGQRIGLPVSGGNVDAAIFARVLAAAAHG